VKEEGSGGTGKAVTILGVGTLREKVKDLARGGGLCIRLKEKECTDSNWGEKKNVF